MKKIAILILCLGVFSQCKKEEPQPEPAPQPTPYTPPTGIIKGKVTQYNQHAETYTTNLNTATVSILNSNISTISDVNGNYTLTGVPAGMHVVGCRRPGSRTMQYQQVNFPGSGTMFLNVVACDSASFTFISASVKDTFHMSMHRLAVTINMVPQPKDVAAMVILSSTGIPDINNSSSFYNGYHEVYIPANSSSYTKVMQSDYPAGTHNVKIYPTARQYTDPGRVYWDNPSSKWVYIGQGTPLPNTYTVTLQ